MDIASPPGHHPELSEASRRLFAELIAEYAIEDSGVNPKDIDGIANYPQTTGAGVGPVPGVSSSNLQWMVQGLGIEQINWWSNGGGNISTAIGTATMAIATGMVLWIVKRRERAPLSIGNRIVERLNAEGNMVHTVDFRQVYASVIEQWMGADSAALLNGRFATLPLFG